MTETPTETATATLTLEPTLTPAPLPSETPTPTLPRVQGRETETATAAASETTTATAATPTNTPTPIPSPTPTTTTLTLNPVADAYVSDSSPTGNFGNAMTLRTDASPIQRSYLRFTVPTLSGGVVSATLRVFANSAVSSGYTVHNSNSSSWGGRPSILAMPRPLVAASAIQAPSPPTPGRA